MKTPIVSTLYKYNDENIVAVAGSLQTLHNWANKYIVDSVHLLQTRNGGRLTIYYDNGLYSETNFVTWSDCVRTVANWRSLDKSLNLVEYFIDGEPAGFGRNAVKEAANLSENPY